MQFMKLVRIGQAGNLINSAYTLHCTNSQAPLADKKHNERHSLPYRREVEFKISFFFNSKKVSGSAPL